MKKFHVLTAVLVALLALWPTTARAIDLTDTFHISGFGLWQYGKTDGNTIRGATEEGSYDMALFGLNVSASLSDRVRVTGQLDINGEGETELDFAFAEYSFSDAAKLRAGIIQHPFGISTEVFDVGTVRNFGELPLSIYGPTGIIGEGIRGISLAGRRDFASAWALAYDVYFGGLTPIDDGLIHRLELGGDGAEEDEETSYRDVIGARLVIETPIDGLSFGFSTYQGEEETDTSTVEARAAQLRFARGVWDVRAELLDQHLHAGAFDQEGHYLEVARRFGPHWQLAARHEVFEISTTLGALAGDPRLEHEDRAFGVSYWVSPNLVFRVSLHQVEGLRFVDEAADAENPDELDEDTQRLIVAVDFTF